jgi:hypothetical protein
LGRLDLDLDEPVFREFVRSSTIFPITLDIARQSISLDFNSDPADEIIAATSTSRESPS